MGSSSEGVQHSVRSHSSSATALLGGRLSENPGAPSITRSPAVGKKMRAGPCRSDVLESSRHPAAKGVLLLNLARSKGVDTIKRFVCEAANLRATFSSVSDSTDAALADSRREDCRNRQEAQIIVTQTRQLGNCWVAIRGRHGFTGPSCRLGRGPRVATLPLAR